METIKFSVTVDNLEVKLFVRQPNFEERRQGQRVYNRAFLDAVESGGILRMKLNDVLTEQGVWGEDKQAKFDTINAEILVLELKLEKGGIRLKDGRQLALNLRKLRNELLRLTIPRLVMDNNTCEKQAQDAQFDYYISTCTRTEDDKPFFKSLEDYLNKAELQYALTCAQKLGSLLHNTDENYEANLPENKFLKKFKLADSKGRLINKDGHLIDVDGRLIDEDGRFVTKDGKFCDSEGNLVTEEGSLIVESQPFLDDDGNPIVLEDEKQTDETSIGVIQQFTVNADNLEEGVSSINKLTEDLTTETAV